MPPSDPSKADISSPRPSAATLYKGPLLILFALIVGENFGREIGASYEGIGNISGERLGEWLGEGVCFATAIAIYGWMSSPWFDRARVTLGRRSPIAVAIWLMFVVMSVSAIAGKAILGEWGGLIGIIAYAAVIGMALLVARQLRTSDKQRT